MDSLSSLVERVAVIMREVSGDVIEPRFKALREGDVWSKAAHEVVTVADEEAERLLTARLRDLLPGVPVVGEEACAAHPSLVDALGSSRAWLVDPLDGTTNFVAGTAEWAVMVALVERGATKASWIWRPMDRRMYLAEHGSGAACNGIPLYQTTAACDESSLRGAVLRRFLDEATAAAVLENSGRFDHVGTGRHCAGFDYPALIEGEQDFVLFWRTLPWDHAPGVLLAEEAGAVVRRLDGTRYQPTQKAVGLLAAADLRVWELAARLPETPTT